MGVTPATVRLWMRWTCCHESSKARVRRVSSGQGQVAQPPIYHSLHTLVEMNYSIEGLCLKLNTREDIAPYLSQIEPNITQLEEIHLCGNTLGVGAAQALAEVLQKASAIRVRTASISPFSSV